LVKLDLTDNQLTTLPERLSRLRAVIIHGNPISPWPPPPPQTLNLERRSAQYNMVISGLMGWAAWRGGKDGMDEAAYAVSRLPMLAGKERTDAEDLAISLVRDGHTYLAHILGRARCTRALPLLRDIATDPSRPPLCRLQATQGLILMDPPAGRTAAIDVLHDATIDRSIREDAIRLLAEHPNAEAKRALEQALDDTERRVRAEAELQLRAMRTPHSRDVPKTR
jgi:hypothetical protein